ncbi:unnamed protein product [Thlaspi arvense]|uniref:RING-type domain-containing protein n=1 Tax=Thlaspi arvense TaxID=13288 RepID=A0AAU9RFC2_THLAR|nr:unnamed protein product [Thlaspi arvense]
MGSACCVAAKERNLPSGRGGDANHNPACSPPWSFRRDNRRRVADKIEDLPHHNKMSLPPSERGSFPGDLATPVSHKSANSEEMGTTSTIRAPSVSHVSISLAADESLASPVCVEVRSFLLAPIARVKNIVESPDIVSSALPKPSSSTSLACDLPSVHTHSLPPRSTPSRRSRGSLTDSKALGLKSPSDYSASEGRSSFVLSTCSNDTATVSHNGSSEGGWSMNAFYELMMAQSQRERWSFDSEYLGSGRRRLSGGSSSSSRFSSSPSVGQQICGSCSKLLTERRTARFDLQVAAVLACGHVYHAECLESMTSETEKYDPLCPICTVGEKQVAKISRKALKAKNYRRCRSRVIDSYVPSECEEEKIGKREGKDVKMDPPSSSTRGSTSKSYTKWNFGSISSKWSKPLGRDSTSKKSFLSRHLISKR